MYNEDIRLAIDVGSSKVCSVVIRRDNYNEPEILAIDVCRVNRYTTAMS